MNTGLPVSGSGQWSSGEVCVSCLAQLLLGNTDGSVIPAELKVILGKLEASLGYVEPCVQQETAQLQS